MKNTFNSSIKLKKFKFCLDQEWYCDIWPIRIKKKIRYLLCYKHTKYWGVFKIPTNKRRAIPNIIVQQLATKIIANFGEFTKNEDLGKLLCTI